MKSRYRVRKVGEEWGEWKECWVPDGPKQPWNEFLIQFEYLIEKWMKKKGKEGLKELKEERIRLNRIPN